MKMQLSIFVILSMLVSAAIADVHFEKSILKIKNIKISIEIAKTPEQQEQGLMFRKKLEKNTGMLFVFNDEKILNFWMKNTIIDLSIAYISKDKTIVDIQEMKATNSLQIDFPTYPSQKPAKYALEMSANWFTLNKIKVGDKIIYDDGHEAKIR